MRAFAASCTGFGWLSAGAAAAAGAPVAGAPTAAGGGASALDAARARGRAHQKQASLRSAPKHARRVASSRATGKTKMIMTAEEVIDGGHVLRACAFTFALSAAAVPRRRRRPRPRRRRRRAAAGRGALEANTDRPGADYRSFELGAPRPELCRDACWGEPQCRAFTYVRPGVQGPRARLLAQERGSAGAARRLLSVGREMREETAHVATQGEDRMEGRDARLPAWASTRASTPGRFDGGLTVARVGLAVGRSRRRGRTPPTSIPRRRSWRRSRAATC